MYKKLFAISFITAFSFLGLYASQDEVITEVNDGEIYVDVDCDQDETYFNQDENDDETLFVCDDEEDTLACGTDDEEESTPQKQARIDGEDTKDGKSSASGSGVLCVFTSLGLEGWQDRHRLLGADLMDYR